MNGGGRSRSANCRTNHLFKSPTGIAHGVEVEAETLYEAAGLGLALKKAGWIEGLRLSSRDCGSPARNQPLADGQPAPTLDQRRHDEPCGSPEAGKSEADARLVK